MTDLLVNELFGPTFQGEGVSIGQLCSFIRLAFCNQKCVFCDSVYSWGYKEELVKNHNYITTPFDRNKEVKEMSIDQIVQHFIPMNPPMVVITGGEPMLQAKKLPELITALMNEIPALTRFEIETAGTIWNDEVAELPFVYFNISPKLANSGNSKQLRYKPDVLSRFSKLENSVFKFVISSLEDIGEIEEIISEINIPNRKIYIMPEGITEFEQKEKLLLFANKIIEKRWNMTTRLHILIWGNKRGV